MSERIIMIILPKTKTLIGGKTLKALASYWTSEFPRFTYTESRDTVLYLNLGMDEIIPENKGEEQRRSDQALTRLKIMCAGEVHCKTLLRQ